MLILLILWILIILLFVQLILYQPLKPVDLLTENTDTGATMVQTGQTLTKSLTLPKTTKKLEIVVYSDKPAKLLLCRVLENTRVIGNQRFITKKGFSRVVVDIKRGFDPSIKCTISLEESNKTLSNVNLKSVKAWIS